MTNNPENNLDNNSDNQEKLNSDNQEKSLKKQLKELNKQLENIQTDKENKSDKNKKKLSKFKITLYTLLALILVFWIASGFNTYQEEQKFTYTKLTSDLAANNIDSAVISPKSNTIKVTDKKDKTYETGYPNNLEQSIMKELQKDKVNITVNNTSSSFLTSFLLTVIPFIIILALFFFLMSNVQGSGFKQIKDFTNSKANKVDPGEISITFDDVAGQDEAKEELEEVADFLKNPDKYLALGAKVPKGVLLYGPPGTGKCITGDSIIVTNKGLMDIQDIPKYYFVDDNNRVHGAKLASYDIDNTRKTIRSASHWYNLGEQDTIKITTQKGFNLEGTPEHPIVILNENGELEFKNLIDLKENDYIGIRYNTNIYGNRNDIDEDTAYLMGLLTGDGGLTVTNKVSLTTTDIEIKEFFFDYVNNRYPNINITTTSDGITYIVNDWKFKQDLIYCGMESLRSQEKKIPDSILQAPENIIKAFLQGLYDTDGWIIKEGNEVGLQCVSYKMMTQVHNLLLNMGIIARFNAKHPVNKLHKTSYCVLISSCHIQSFHDRLGFRLTRKQNLLYNYIQSKTYYNTNDDLFYNIYEKIAPLYKSFIDNGVNTKEIGKLMYKIKQKNKISRESLSLILKHSNKNIKDKHENYYYLLNLLNSEIFFTPVIKKENSRNVVYDFTVPQTHSFISNGVISHNTLMAQALAKTSAANYYSVGGSEFIEMLVGAGAARVRTLFEDAKKTAPSIIFIDELDAIGKQRGAGVGNGNDEREVTINQLLKEMDGFDTHSQVIVVAATNRIDTLDPALLRPGRFDRHIPVSYPDRKGRKEILDVHIKGKPLADDVDLQSIADSTTGFTGADLANVVNESALLAARKEQKIITNDNLEESILRTVAGPEKKNRLLNDKEKAITAYHEVGHALVGHYLEHTDPIHKISVVSRGQALGFTMSLPVEDTFLNSRSKLIDSMAMALGGRAAENYIFNEVTTGASDDLKRVTNTAKQMILKYAMSDDLAPRTFGSDQENPFLGRELAHQSDYSIKTAEKLDDEIDKLVTNAYNRALETLKTYNKELEYVSQALIKYETIDKKQFLGLLEGKSYSEVFKDETNSKEEVIIDNNETDLNKN